MTPVPVQYTTADISGIELIRPLWDQLNAHHHANARAFREVYSGWTFDDRKHSLEKLAETSLLRIDLALDPAAGRYIAYCVSSLSRDLDGEIESVFVEERCRSAGIGSELVSRALAWLGEGHAQRIRVSVADVNEEAFAFYRKFGFFQRMTVLEQKND